MYENTERNNDVNGTGTLREGVSSGRCPVDEQRRPDRHHATARMSWTREVNIAVMECYFLSKPMDEEGKPLRGYRKRMHAIWKERQQMVVTEQRLCDQARMIKKNGWLTNLELEDIKRRVLNDNFCEEGEETVGEDIGEGHGAENLDATGIDNSCVFEDVEELDQEERDILEGINHIIDENLSRKFVGFKKIERSVLREKVSKVNRVLNKIRTENLSGTNTLIKACSIYIGGVIGLKPVQVRHGNNKEPWWKRRIQSSMAEIRRHINILERKKKGDLKKDVKYKDLERKYFIKKKGLDVVLEELKQRLQAKSKKIKRYQQRIDQFKINKLFQQDQKKVYQQLNSKTASHEKPDAKESEEFWSNIWGKEVKHNANAEWFKELKQEGACHEKQTDLMISTEMVSKQTKKIPNWKCPGPDGVQGYWLKHLTTLHSRIANQMNDIIVNGYEIPKWMTTGNTVLCQKDPNKGAAVDNYRPISCLPLMWKLLTGIISTAMYSYLESNDRLPAEQKGCRKESRGTKDQLLIDKTVMNDCRKRHTNLAMAWVDYKKAYDMIPHSWIIESLEFTNVADNVIKFIKRSMKSWNVNLSSNGEFLANVKIKRGIFQGDSLSPLLFVVCLIPLTQILRKVKCGYALKNGDKLNHLLFMDDLKLFAKDEREINGLLSTVQIFSNDIQMEFGIKKCGVLVMKRGKATSTEGIELPSGDTIKDIEKEGYKYLGILEFDFVKENDMIRNFQREYFRRARLVMRSRLNGRNKIRALNTWAISLLRYGAGILNWRKNVLDEMDRKTRKIMTINKEFHPKSDIDRLYVPRSKGGRGLLSCKSCIMTEENNLGWYVKHQAEPLLVAVKNSKTINTEDVVSPTVYKETERCRVYNSWKNKVMHGQYLRELDGKDCIKSWKWLKDSDLKGCTEALICSAQEQAIRTNNTKFYIDKTSDSPICRMCGARNETVSHIISECSKLAQKEYKRRHDNVGKYIHWKLCKKYNIDSKARWYEHSPKGIVESNDIKILWDCVIQCDKEIDARRPDIVIVDKLQNEVKIIDVAIPGDVRVLEKEIEKIEKYGPLKDEIARLWDMRKVSVIPIVVGALGAVSTRFQNFVKDIGITLKIEYAQKTALLGTARILRLVLNC